MDNVTVNYIILVVKACIAGFVTFVSEYSF